jgi:hypothetical protein
VSFLVWHDGDPSTPRIFSVSADDCGPITTKKSDSLIRIIDEKWRAMVNIARSEDKV